MARVAPAAQCAVWGTAHEFIRGVPALLHAASLISLDHDLVAPPASAGHPARDPGDGLDAVRFLVSQPVVRPVIIHSSNADRAAVMRGEFELAGWPCTRVAPLGEGWIEEDWAPVVARLLGRS